MSDFIRNFKFPEKAADPTALWSCAFNLNLPGLTRGLPFLSRQFAACVSIVPGGSTPSPFPRPSRVRTAAHTKAIVDEYELRVAAVALPFWYPEAFLTNRGDPSIRVPKILFNTAWSLHLLSGYIALCTQFECVERDEQRAVTRLVIPRLAQVATAIQLSQTLRRFTTHHGREINFHRLPSPETYEDLNEDDLSLVPIARTSVFSNTAFICRALPGTTPNPHIAARARVSYDVEFRYVVVEQHAFQDGLDVRYPLECSPAFGKIGDERIPYWSALTQIMQDVYDSPAIVTALTLCMPDVPSAVQDIILEYCTNVACLVDLFPLALLEALARQAVAVRAQATAALQS